MAWIPLLLALVVSVVYYRSSPPTQPMLLRLLVSAHGVAIVCLFFIPWMVISVSDRRHYARFVTVFEYIGLVPVGLIVVSFALFRGPCKVHLLQALNLGALYYVMRLGVFMLTPLY